MSITLKDLPAHRIVRVHDATLHFSKTLSIKTVTEGNAKEHWRVRHSRAKKQRINTRRAFMGEMIPHLPVVVGFTRLSSATMDDDNLPGSLKHLRDEIACLYGCGDSARDPIVWKYAQEKCKRGEYGVVVTITAAGAVNTVA